MMGNYNINYLENKEKQNLETIIQPYDINMTKKHQATRIKDESNPLKNTLLLMETIPFFIVKFLTHQYKQIILLNWLLLPQNLARTAIKEQIHDKTNYSPKDLKHSIKQLNSETFYSSTVPSEMLRSIERKLNSKYSIMCQSKQFL